MDLNRQDTVAIQVFQQKRKTLVLAIITEDRFRKGMDQFFERPSHPRSVSHDALIFAVIHNFPTFGPNTVGGNVFVQLGLKAISSPKIGSKNRFKTERSIGLHFVRVSKKQGKSTEKKHDKHPVNHRLKPGGVAKIEFTNKARDYSGAILTHLAPFECTPEHESARRKRIHGFILCQDT